MYERRILHFRAFFMRAGERAANEEEAAAGGARAAAAAAASIAGALLRSRERIDVYEHRGN